ncbi:hypothetical protein ACFYT4_26895 [Streptomyces sp. NPDC004609]|uniref:hypothetical protein n=1 Tax=Streptomyces sp. NPDC004609 TaxID=3364704 RepID=UPI00369C5006
MLMSPPGRRRQAGSVNVTRNVVPRDLADGPACRVLALLFWSGTALITFGPVLLTTAISIAWMQPITVLTPLTKVAGLQVGLIAAVVTPLYFAPGICRLARSARFALLGPVAGTIALAVLLCLKPEL